MASLKPARLGRALAMLLPVLAAGAALPAAAQDAPIGQIRWEIADRFRFFSSSHAMTPHIAAHALFEAAGGRTDEFGRRQIDGEWVGPVLFAERRLAAATGPGALSGWAAGLMTAGSGNGTCWDGALRRVDAACLADDSGGVLGPRLYPKAAEVSLTLAHGGAFAGKFCRWVVVEASSVTASETDIAPCDQPTTAVVALDSPFHVEARSFNDPGGYLPYYTVSLLNQVARFELIVGLGDSYAAGEGNPDVPAGYVKARAITGTTRPAPTSDRQWLDWACHRSVYSHQLRVALQLAVEDPHRVVSFLGYACSGAGVPQVMRGADAAADYVDPVSEGRLANIPGANRAAGQIVAQAEWSQLDQAVRDLCADTSHRDARKRPRTCERLVKGVDLVLLSVGGNDVGFTDAVKWVVTGPGIGRVRFLTGALDPATMRAHVDAEKPLPGCDDGRPGRECTLAARYASLAEAISRRLQLVDRGRVVIGPYPDILSNELGGLCSAEAINAGADSEHFVATDDARVRKLQEKLFDRNVFTQALKRAAKATGWTYTDALSWSGAFNRHGVCAAGAGPHNALAMPRLVNLNWENANPDELGAYAPRQRWIRTFNDSILYQFQVTPVPAMASNPRQPIDYHFQAGISGFFHPTAEGQAAMADALLPAVRCRLDNRREVCP